MRAREADPIDARDVVACSEQLAELGPKPRRKVAAPRVDILPQECDLADPTRSELLDLRDDLARTPALLAPPYGGHDAVRARRVASHRHLHPGLESALRVQRQVSREVLVRAETSARNGVPAGADPRAEVRDRAGAERNVDERVLLEDAVALSLGVATTDGDHDVGSIALHGARVPEVCRQPGIRLLTNRARVEHDDIRLIGRRRLTEPERFEHALDPLGVVGVHLAPEGRDVVSAHEATV